MFNCHLSAGRHMAFILSFSDPVTYEFIGIQEASAIRIVSFPENIFYFLRGISVFGFEPVAVYVYKTDLPWARTFINRPALCV